MNRKEEFVSLYNQNIKREGAKELLEYLLSDKSDFFTAPASTKYHGNCINVYNCLKGYLSRPCIKNLHGLTCEEETLAIVSLLHDVCKINTYKISYRNVKDENGIWQSVPSFEFEDLLPYGHGEKSVYIITGFMKLTREEAFAIRYHMGFSGSEDKRSIGSAFERFPLALALNIADMEATYFIEKRGIN